MKRTQLYMDESLFQLLTLVSLEKKTTISDLVRKAIEKVYGRRAHGKDRVKLLQAAFGIWQHRKDLPDTDTYVRALRKDTRSTRLGI